MNPHHRDDELLSAYLAAELDDAATAELEARLAADAALRARLDGVHAVVVALRGLDDVDPPAGYARRLRERLDTERGTAVPGQVVSLDPVRARRRGTWRSVGTAAAALVFVAAIGTAVARWDGRVDGGGGDLAAGDAESVEDAAAPEEQQRSLAAEAGEAAEGDGDTQFDAAAPAETAAAGGTDDADAAGDDTAGAAEDLATATESAAETGAQSQDSAAVAEGPALADEAAVRERYTGLEEIDRLLGTPVDEAPGLAAERRAEVEQAPAFPSGEFPAACLDAVAPADGPPEVIVRVERVNFAGSPALVYVHVGATAGAAALDRVRIDVVGTDCAVVLSL